MVTALMIWAARVGFMAFGTLQATAVGYLLHLLEGYRTQTFYANAAGYRKLTKMLRRDHGIYINLKKIYRLCSENGLLLEKRSKSPRSFRRISINRIVTRPNQLWQCDLKYGKIHGDGRFFFVLAFIDVFTRKVVGAHVGLRCRSGDLRNALAQAIASEKITSEDHLVIRSDNGPQMTSVEFGEWIEKTEAKLTHEFIPVQTPNKNAYIESFFSILELELFRVRYFPNFQEAYAAVFEFIRFYNEVRIHGSLGDITPVEAHARFNRGEPLKMESLSM